MKHRAMALAGVFQSAALARSVATRGNADEQALATSINSIYALEAASVEQVFQPPGGLRLGLDSLVAHFNGERDPDILRAVMTLLQLSGRLMADADMSQRVRDGVDAARVHALDAGAVHESQLQRLGELYARTLSQMKPTVVVRGNPQYLRQDRFVAWVRAVLLAGVRSGILWQQLGGSRWRLILQSRQLANAARAVLDNL
ncbi:MAG: DUF489 family protein [Xanthomonadales bacterium]|nr:DUF489 family protein [Xanthomonadales bacterium]